MVGYEMLAQAQRDLTAEKVNVIFNVLCLKNGGLSSNSPVSIKKRSLTCFPFHPEGQSDCLFDLGRKPYFVISLNCDR